MNNNKYLDILKEGINSCKYDGKKVITCDIEECLRSVVEFSVIQGWRPPNFTERSIGPIQNKERPKILRSLYLEYEYAKIAHVEYDL